jgi:hypothetical protein
MLCFCVSFVSQIYLKARYIVVLINISSYMELMFEICFHHTEFTVKNAVKYFSPVMFVIYEQIQSFFIHEGIEMNNISKGQMLQLSQIQMSKYETCKMAVWNIVKKGYFLLLKEKDYVCFVYIQALSLHSFNIFLYYLWISLSLIQDGQDCIMCGS